MAADETWVGLVTQVEQVTEDQTVVLFGLVVWAVKMIRLPLCLMTEHSVGEVTGPQAPVVTVILPPAWLMTEHWVVVVTGVQVLVLAVIQPWVGLVSEL